MANDLVADLLTRLRNAQRVKHRAVRVQKSNQSKAVLDVLKAEGFIDWYEVRPAENPKFEEIEVGLKYYSNGDPAMSLLRRVSSPGHRVYAKTEGVQRVFNGLGIAIVSTSQGVMSDREARRRKIGGEVLAQVG